MTNKAIAGRTLYDDESVNYTNNAVMKKKRSLDVFLQEVRVVLQAASLELPKALHLLKTLAAVLIVCNKCSLKVTRTQNWSLQLIQWQTLE